MTNHSELPQPSVRKQPAGKIAVRSMLVAGGLVAGLLLCESLLWIAGIPRFYRPHSFPSQFAFLTALDDGEPVYVNLPDQQIRFVYDGNPRGYFGPKNEVDHQTNGFGFRGPPFPLQQIPGGFQQSPEKRAGTVRLVFLGDSFTFGEGVRFEDTYPQVTAALLKDALDGSVGPIESYNLGVGGYNTRQELYVLKNRGGLTLAPDLVVLGYVLNDAEPPLFAIDLVTGEYVRLHRPISEQQEDERGLQGDFSWLRTWQLGSKVIRDRETSRQTEEYYLSLYRPSNPGWEQSRKALRQIVDECKSREIPCCVVIFPVLHSLDAGYPFLEIHRLVSEEASAAGAQVVDLLPAFIGQNAPDLWVHPSDHHPNEKANKIAAHTLADAIVSRELLKRAGSGSQKSAGTESPAASEVRAGAPSSAASF